jgi:glycosyltransferase involved in cell wall biosynthesis
MKLSIIIPVFNEEQTIHLLLSKVYDVEMQGVSKEIIICDDGSSGNSFQHIQTFQSGHPDTSIKVFRNDTNCGKGAAIIKCIAAVSGDYVIIQDADLEYEPSDYTHLIQPILTGQADVVYGNRFHGNQDTRRQYVLHFWANKFLTKLSNLLTGFSLQDMGMLLQGDTGRAFEKCSFGGNLLWI